MRGLKNIGVQALLLTALFSASPAAAQVWEVDARLLELLDVEAGAQFGRTLAVGDFNGDGLDDLAVGSPSYTQLDHLYLGRVDIFLAQAGRGFAPPQALTPVIGDNCLIGFALAAGNFDDSPQDELAIGIPGCAGGRVSVVYFGETTVGFQVFGQSQIGSEAAEDFDLFGQALAVGDLDGDGYDDLAIGAPGEEVTFQTDVGMLHLVYGSPTGIDASTGELFIANSFVAGIATQDEAFGSSLASGDFDADGFDDLAVSAPGRSISGNAEVGQIHVAYGSDSGLGTAGHQLFDDASFGFLRETGDRFGHALAAGNFDAPGGISCIGAQDPCADDLVVGIPDEAIGTVEKAGHVILLFGSAAAGLSTVGFQDFDQSDFGFNLEEFDRFGKSLATGRLDSRSFDDSARWAEDLVIGSPGEDLHGSDDGAALLMFGSTSGLSVSTAQLVSQSPGSPTFPPLPGTGFGEALAVGDFDGDGVGDLAAGLPESLPNDPVTPGAVHVLFGALFADGFESIGTGTWSAAVP